MALTIESVVSNHSLNLALSEDLSYGLRRIGATFNKEGAQFTSGTATDQVSKVAVKRLTISPSSSSTLDLNTDFPDPFGNAQDFAKVKSIEVYVPVAPALTQSTALILFDTVTAYFNQGAFAAKAGDMVAYRMGSGVTVVAATNDKLKFTNSDATNTATIDIIVMGN